MSFESRTAERFERIEAEIVAALRNERRLLEIVERQERQIEGLQKQLFELRRELHHRYPATTAVTVRPA